MDQERLLREQIADLQVQLDRLRDEANARSVTSRRRMIATAGASAAGVVVALGGGQRVAAADPDDVVKDVDNAVTGETILTGGRLTVRGTDAAPSLFGASVSGLSDAGTFNGVVGSTSVADGYALIGLADREAGARSQLLLEPNGGPPPTGAEHRLGELAVDETGTLWFTTKGSPVPAFRTLSGAGAAGAFYAIAPVRVYDSRRSNIPESGLFAPNSHRTISVEDGYDDDGTVTTPNAVPEGATAIACNISVAGTTGSNFLSVVPGGSTAFTTSSINWTGTGQALGNGQTVKLNDRRQVEVFCGDQAGSAHVIIDVAGYYV